MVTSAAKRYAVIFILALGTFVLGAGLTAMYVERQVKAIIVESYKQGVKAGINHCINYKELL